MKSISLGVAIVALALMGAVSVEAEEPSGHLATIQERARESRESFLRGETVTESVNTKTTSEEGNSQLQSLEERLAELKEKAILLSYGRVIKRLESYTLYLDNIISRLEMRLVDDTAAGKDTVAIQEKVDLASTFVMEASSTIAVAAASSTEALSTGDPALILADIKLMLQEASRLLEGARLSITEAVDEAQNL